MDGIDAEGEMTESKRAIGTAGEGFRELISGAAELNWRFERMAGGVGNAQAKGSLIGLTGGEGDEG